MTVPVLLAPAASARAPDRLDLFRQLAASRLGPAQVVAGDPASDDSVDVYRELYALLDEEIVDSLASGGLFASPAFLQDRLDAFTEAWGGAFLEIARVDRYLVGAFRLSDGPTGNTVRVYGRLRGEAALLTTLAREGRPVVHALPPGPQGTAQFLVVWEGVPTGRGTRSLRIDLVRPHGDSVKVAWSTADVFPDGLVIRAYAVRGAEIRIRYEVHYAGWVPGCDGQTEQEDVYRLAPGAAAFQRVSRREYDGWHREFHRTVSRLLRALVAADRATLVSLVPDPTLRERLPAGLRAEPACDAPEGVSPDTVSVAASTEQHRPWTLTFRRAGGWRLIAAAPVEAGAPKPLE
jgi:hypothetical protein